MLFRLQFRLLRLHLLLLAPLPLWVVELSWASLGLNLDHIGAIIAPSCDILELA